MASFMSTFSCVEDTNTIITTPTFCLPSSLKFNADLELGFHSVKYSFTQEMICCQLTLQLMQLTHCSYLELHATAIATS